MALMYADGAMFLGNGTGTNEQTALIGTTKFNIVSALAGTLAFSVANAADVKLTTDITMLTPINAEGEYTGTFSILPHNDTVLTTEIHGATLAVENVANILAARTLLTISITEGLNEPGIKDTTKALSIIDSTDTYVETQTETEVI